MNHASTKEFNYPIYVSHISFDEALEKLNIVDYREKIFNSNSHGELIHLIDYIYIAENIKEEIDFRSFFIDVVEWSNKSWKRPESIYQHILRIMEQPQDETMAIN